MPAGLDKLAEGVGKAIETVPDLYDDALKTATQESGKTLALIPRAINAALVPLRQWIAEREYKLAETEKLLAQKLENVAEDKIVTPEAYVAVPAIQAISYSMDSEELRNLYANLLARAMNSDTKNTVHPCFVEIIKQMSPIDSLVFKTIMERSANPIIDLVYNKYESDIPIAIESRTIIENVTDINVAPVETVGISIDNLIRQGLISIPKGNAYVNSDLYNNILETPFYINQQQSCPNTPDGFIFSNKKKMIVKTHLGDSFYKNCVLDSL